jgi:beta-phosphoglucomutase
LDGVIVDTARYHFLSWKEMAGELGINLTLDDNERLKGVGRTESLEIILQIGSKVLSAKDKEDLLVKKNKLFVSYIEAMKPEEIYEGSKELFQELRNKSIKVGLASSSKNAMRVLEKLGIVQEFDAKVDGNMITESKPDPEIFLRASEQLKVDPMECVVIEDAVAGVEAAKRAGLKCVGIGRKENLKEADLVVDHISRLNYEVLYNL